MAQGIFGAEGVFYMTAYVAMANFLLWSHGVIVMSGKSDIKSLKKVFTSTDNYFYYPWYYLLCCTNPCSSDCWRTNGNDCKHEHTYGDDGSRNQYCSGRFETSILSLQIILLKLCKADCNAICIGRSLLFYSSFTARKDYCDTGNSVSGRSDGKLFALRYEKDSVYAAEIFAMTTIVSIVTVPFSMLFC